MTITYFLVKFEPTTGKSKHLLEVSRRLVERGATVHLITNVVRWKGPPEALQHLRIHEIGGGTNRAYLKTREVASLVQAIGTDIFEIHGGLSMTMFAKAFARAVSKPTVVNIHSQPADVLREWRHLKVGDWFRNRRYVADLDDGIGLLLKAIGPARLIHQPNIKAVFLPSQQLKQSFGGDPRVRYLPSGAKLPERVPDRNLASVEPTALFFGRAVMVRGIDTLIEAFEMIAEKHPSLRLQLLLLDDVDTNRIGRRKDQSSFTERIDLRVGRQDNMSEHFSRATLAAFPFRSSGCIPEQPLTLIEAMAYGVPCITSPVGTVGEIVTDRVNGLLVRPNRPRELAEALDLLLGNASMRERLGAEGRRTVHERFNWETIADQTYRTYEHILND